MYIGATSDEGKRKACSKDSSMSLVRRHLKYIREM